MILKDKAFLIAIIFGVQFVSKEIASWMVIASVVVGVIAIFYEAKQ